MAIPEQIYVDLDLHKNQLLNPSLHRVTNFPPNPVEGQLCYLTKNLGNKVGKLPYYFDGISWKVFNGVFSIETAGDVSSVISTTVDGILLTQTVTGLLGKSLGTLSVGYLKYNGTNWIFDNSTTDGTVTSVGLTAPSIFTVSGSPVTTSGNLSFAWNGSVNDFVLANGSVVARSTYLTVSDAVINYQPKSTNLTTFSALGNPSSNGYVLSANTDGAMSWIPVVEGGGTVTSVGLSAPSIFTVSGSPVVTNGTLSFAWNGSNTQLVRGDGSTILQSSLQPTHVNLNSLSNLLNPASNAHLMMTPAGVMSWDTTVYLTNDILTALQDPTGFENLTSSNMSFVSATRTFTISPTGASFNVWIRGIKFVKTSESVVISNVAGVHYIYYNQSGVLVSSNIVWDFSTVASVALIYWDGTNALNLCEERHMTVMDWATHKYLHSTRGTQYVNGFGATYTLNNDTAIGIGLASGQISDEDIPLVITNGTINGYLTQPISGTNGAFPVYYRVGTNGNNGTWRKDTATTLPYKNAGGTAPPNYNLLNGGTWQQSATPANYFVAYFIFATDNILEPIISVQGQTVSANIDDARNNNNPATLAYADFPAAEAKLLYRIILQTRPAYTGNIFLSQIVEVFDYRNIAISTSIATGGTGTVTSVGLSTPSIFTVSGSPITSAGVLSFAFNGLSTNFLLADGSTVARSTYQPSSANLTTVSNYSSIVNLTSLVNLANPGATARLQITSGGVMSWDTTTYIQYTSTPVINNFGANSTNAPGHLTSQGYLISDSRGLSWRGGLVSTDAYWGLGQDATLSTSFKPFIIGGGTTDSTWFKIDPQALVKTTITGGLTLANMASGVIISTAGVLSPLSSAVGNVLISGGSGIVPTWGKVGLTSHVSGILPVANGGTNLSALGTANQILGVNSGASALEYKSISQGSGVSITHGAGSITIAIDSALVTTKYIGTWAVGASLGASGATATTATSITGTGYYVYQITHNLNTLTPNVVVEDGLTGEPLLCPWYTATITTFNQSVPTYTSNNTLVIKLSTDGLTAILNKTLKIIVTA